jgi:hypothetical protein
MTVPPTMVTFRDTTRGLDHSGLDSANSVAWWGKAEASRQRRVNKTPTPGSKAECASLV